MPARSASLKILMQPRPNVLTHRGGDTVVMERTAEELRELGFDVTIDPEMKAPLGAFDVIHLFNFALPDLLRLQSERCAAAGKPFVITSLYEDWPRFFNQMQSYFLALQAYLKHGQQHHHWPALLNASRGTPPCEPLDNSFAAARATLVLASGEQEAAAIRALYPSARVEIAQFGCDLRGDASPDLFRKETGLTDFVLSVGRLETRKNQLGLLKALEESDLPLVLAGGGFTYQPEYEQLCRSFRRKGKVIILGRLEEALLKSMYAAARVHALPSWYELPGLVTLEAMASGSAVVVSDFGTPRDYVGGFGFYAAPDDPQAILNAVTAAFYSPQRPGAKEHVHQFTWRRSAERVGQLYEVAVSAR